jgi:hypothetical protein
MLHPVYPWCCKACKLRDQGHGENMVHARHGEYCTGGAQSKADWRKHGERFVPGVKIHPEEIY